MLGGGEIIIIFETCGWDLFVRVLLMTYLMSRLSEVLATAMLICI